MSREYVFPITAENFQADLIDEPIPRLQTDPSQLFSLKFQYKKF